MSITAERKQALIAEYGAKEGDTGSPEVQVAILSERIRNLTDHLRPTKKTFTRGAGCWSWSASGAGCWIISSGRVSGATRALIGRLGLRR